MDTFGTVLAAFLTGGVCLKGIQLLETWWVKRSKKLSDKQRTFNYLRGLPYEMKGALANFLAEGVHTLRGNPSSPEIRQLLQDGVLKLGGGGGTYDVVNSYLTIRNDIWEIMQSEWAIKDPAVLPLLEEIAKLESQAENG